MAYICNVKTYEGHEAAAPQTAAYFVPECKRSIAATASGHWKHPEGIILVRP